ncbi:MAG: DUF362 domain-containing protein [Tannerella sp.]|jgi:uncharacterized Fe-S center protein|nr:DUF362 domain-containing protein [Tannerella sp.]
MNTESKKEFRVLNGINDFKQLDRRDFLKVGIGLSAAAITGTLYGCGTSPGSGHNKKEEPDPNGEGTSEKDPKVYMTKEISPESLIHIYEALGRKATGKVAIKLSMGEPGGKNYLKPELVGDLVRLVNGTFIDANTAYGGNRATTELHLKAAEDHGFTAIAPVDILDSEGEIELPIDGGKHLTKDIVGSHFTNYDFMINLSHFKGHAMGGFGGALKNMSIGIASSGGKVLIHSAGTSTTEWGNPEQNDFLESMAEAAKAIVEHCGDNIIYISVMNNLSVDCDCDSAPADPEMGDIGILASLDPVALDKACVDQVYASADHGKIHLIERIESRNGTHILEHAETLGIGSRKYELIPLD